LGVRAAYYEALGGPENLQIGDRPDPVPEAGQMLVRTRAAGVGFWDVGMMRGGGPQAPVDAP
jgi:NADPH2:quinone reductase